MRSAIFFVLGVVIALLALVVLSLAVTGCAADTPATSTAPTPSVAGPVGPDTQPAPTNASPTDTADAFTASPDSPTATPEPTDTPSAAATPEYMIVTLLRKDAIPAILDPDFVPLSEANEQMEDDELVLGVSLDGDSRAYSVNLLSRHEIVNDVVGGRPVAVTW